MKRRIAAIVLAILLTVSPSSFTAVAQEFVNPFACEDAVRQETISVSQQQVDSQRVFSEYNSSEEPSEAESELDGYVVQFKDSVSLYSIYQCVSEYSYKLLADSETRLFEVEIDNLSNFNSTYGNLTEYVGESKTRTPSKMPNDAYYDYQWAIPKMNLPAAWDETTGSADIKVAVIDSGFYRSHEDISNKTVLEGVNVCTGVAYVATDEIGHGTMVTSVIAATTNNALGMAGVCWNVSIIPYKVAQSDGSIDSADVISALYTAADTGCDVINISLGGYERDPLEQAAIDYAIEKGCIIVAAAGNEGRSTSLEKGQYSYPASDEGVVSTAATNRFGNRSDFSQYNDKVDICAPGEEILVASADGSDEYAIASGTSFSSPYVAAVAALVRSQDDSITSEFFDQLLKETSTDMGTTSKDDYYGWGLVNAESIVKKAICPVICGVENNGVYDTARTITFNNGAATLNGNSFTSGSIVSNAGKYTLIVTNDSGNTTTVKFVVDRIPLTVNGIVDGGSYQKVTISFSRGTATLNGNLFSSGTSINAEGSYTLILTGPYGNTATYQFTIDHTAPIITGVTDGKSYDTLVTIKFNEGTGVLNGKIIKSGYTVGLKGSYTLVVTDAAGNATTVNFVISTNYAGNIEIDMTTALTGWVLDETSNMLFAISSNKNLLLCINAITLNTEQTIPLNSAPTDIINDDGKLYVALDAVNKIVVIDIATKTIKQTISTTTDPYRIVKDGNKIYYVEFDQWCELHVLDLETGVDSRITGFGSINTFYFPDIAINTEEHLLYIGESGSSGSKFYYYSTAEEKVISTTNYDNSYGFPYPSRVVLYDGKYVFYAGNAFSPLSATKLQGDYNPGQTVIFAKYDCVFTNSAVYDEETHVKAGDFRSTINMIEASETGNLYIYDQTHSCIAKISSPSETINAYDIIAQVSGIPAAEVPSVTESVETGIEGELSLDMISELTQWVEDDESDTLFAISEANKALFFIDAATLTIEKTIRFTSGPTDIEMGGGKLYIPLDGAYQIAVVDIGTQSVEETLYTSSDPYRVALDGYKLYYAEQDQWCDVYEYNLTTKTDKAIAVSMLYYPDLAVNTESHILYIGTSRSSSCNLIYYSTTNEAIIGRSVSYEDCVRSIVFDGTYVYFDGKAFDPNDPSKIVSSISEKNREHVLVSKYGFVFTNYSLYYYTEGLFEKVADFDSEITLADISDHFDIFLYDKANQVIVREDGQDVPPEVTGVVDGGAYLEPVTITFDKGSALLDNKEFISGGTVSEVGEHTLVVTDDEGLSTTIIFTIYETQENDGVEVTFKDDNLKQALINNGVDSNNDGLISRGEMRMQFHSLYLGGSTIADLTGMEYAVNLVGLDLSDNNITDISALSGLTNLTVLDLLTNQISDLAALSKLTNLCSLDVSNNAITDISVLANLTVLGKDGGWLYLDDNQISDISVLPGLLYVTDLSLANNPISNFNPLQQMTNLQCLSLSGDGLISINLLQNMTNLEFVDISNNNITDISVLKSMDNLIGLSLSANKITDITALKDLTSLNYLDLSDNAIRDISALQGMNSLNVLNLSKNKIEDIHPIQDIALMNLDVSQNYLDFSNGSDDMAVINSMIASNEFLTIVYIPQKARPVITIAPYTTSPTNQSITVTATTDKGKLNVTSHTFTENGSFDFIATDDEGIKTVVTVMITNIDKTAPVVTGVNNNGLYNGNKTITFNEGTAKLNGVSFTSGSTVSTDKSYTLVVTDAAGNSTTVNFQIDKTAPVVTGVVNDASYNSNKTITFSDGTAKLNGAAFTSGSTVSAENSYTLVVTDTAGNNTTINFKIDRTSPIITINPYTTTSTIGAVTVTVSTNEGTLNEASHTFTENGSFTFEATDAARQ